MRQKLLLLLLGVLSAFPALARDFVYTYEGQTITYTVIDESIRTCMTKDATFPSSGNRISGALVIPTIVKDGPMDYTVTEIGSCSFYGCSGLTSVVIPNSVTEIGEQAFRECSGLTSIEIPNSVTEIGHGGF